MSERYGIEEYNSKQSFISFTKVLLFGGEENKGCGKGQKG